MIPARRAGVSPQHHACNGPVTGGGRGTGRREPAGRAGGIARRADRRRPVPVPGVATILVGWTRWRRDLASRGAGAAGPDGSGLYAGPAWSHPPGSHRRPAGRRSGTAGVLGGGVRRPAAAGASSLLGCHRPDRESRHRFSRQRSPVRDSQSASHAGVAARGSAAGRGWEGSGQAAGRNVEGPPGRPGGPPRRSAPGRGYRAGRPPGPSWPRPATLPVGFGVAGQAASNMWFSESMVGFSRLELK